VVSRKKWKTAVGGDGRGGSGSVEKEEESKERQGNDEQ